MSGDSPLYLGFDLSTQQLKGIAVTSSLKVEHEVKFDFDADSKGFSISKGWLQAIDGVLQRFQDAGIDFNRVRGISGAGMQHRSVYWNIRDAFAHPYSPNWQDASTQEQCDAFDAHLGDATRLALLTGSKAHHLWDIKAGAWNENLLSLAAGSNNTSDLKQKLGAAEVPEDGGAFLGNISPYFVQRYGFSPTCAIAPSTGDNPSTILALPLRPLDAIVSLGTSTTLLMSTPYYKPNPAVHFMNHPTTPGLYMFMLCYKNGGLAREHVRDSLPPSSDAANPWQQFDQAASTATPLGQSSDLNSPMKIGLFFPRPEIVPNVRAGTWRFIYKPSTSSLMAADETTWNQPGDDARANVESQFLSLRLRSRDLVESPTGPNAHLPPQPRRVYLVGGASRNPAIAKIAGQVLGGWEGVYRLDVGENACALGATYKAVWSVERKEKQSFEELIGGRWKEDKFVKKIADGYQEGIFEKYGPAVEGLDLIEKELLKGEKNK